MLLVGFEGKHLTDKLKRNLDRLRPAGVILFSRNYEDPHQLRRLTQDLQEWAAAIDLPPPFLVAVDHEGGRVQRWRKPFTCLPAAEMVGSTGDPSLARELGRAAGKELAAVGVHINFAPVLDVLSCRSNPAIGDRSYGSDPEVVRSFGLAFLSGMEAAGVTGVAKHFPGHGSTNFDSHERLGRTNRSLSDLEGVDLVPFAAAIASGVSAIMPAHVLYPEIDGQFPATLSTPVLWGLLRQTMGFGGTIVSDDMVMGAIASGWGVPEGCVRAVAAGTDLLVISRGTSMQHQVVNHLGNALANGTLTEDRVASSISRVLRLKEKVAKQSAARDKARLEEIGSKKHHRLADAVRSRAREAGTT